MYEHKIKYACGHGEHLVRVVSESQRDQELELRWYEKNLACPECRKAAQRSEHIEAEVIRNSFSRKTFIVIKGNANPIKETLKNHGFRWGRYFGDQDPLGGPPRKTWGIPVSENPSDVIKLCEFLRSIGVNDTKVRTSPLVQN